MLAAWFLYAIAVSTLAALAALALEGACRVAGRPTRWLWAAVPVLAAAVALGGPVPVPRDGGGAGEAGEVALGPLSLLPSPPDGGAAWSGWFDLASPLSHPLLRTLDGPLAVLWALLTAWLLARLATGALYLHRRMRSWTATEIDGRPVLLSKETGPAVLGLGGRIVVPRWVARAEPAVRSLVLEHEDEHRRARDPALVFTATMAVVLMPWNLPLWWIRNRLRAAVELDCDERVLRARPTERRRYGMLLLELGRDRRASDLLAPAFAGRNALPLRRRIDMLTRTPPRRPLPRALALSCVGLVLIAAACVVPAPDDDGAGVTGPEGEPRASELRGPEGEDLVEGPTFTPFTAAPEITNRRELQEILEAEYPTLLRNAGLGGTAMVHFLVRDDGSLQKVELAESSGRAELDAAALRVAERFAFAPARNQGEAVPVWIQIPITFTVD